MIILEGTDGVGKTITISNLKEYKLQDRDKFISKYMNFNISTERRAKLYYDYLNNSDKIIIFLINNDREELEKRINNRETIDEYDKMTYVYNLLYLETYNYMKYKNMLNNHLYLVDTTDLNIEKQVLKVKELLECLV